MNGNTLCFNSKRTLSYCPAQQLVKKLSKKKTSCIGSGASLNYNFKLHSNLTFVPPQFFTRFFPFMLSECSLKQTQLSLSFLVKNGFSLIDFARVFCGQTRAQISWSGLSALFIAFNCLSFDLRSLVCHWQWGNHYDQSHQAPLSALSLVADVWVLYVVQAAKHRYTVDWHSGHQHVSAFFFNEHRSGLACAHTANGSPHAQTAHTGPTLILGYHCKAALLGQCHCFEIEQQVLMLLPVQPVSVD